MRNFGFFVDVPGLAMSGLVHLSRVTDDFYVFDIQRGQLTGRRHRRVIRLGDQVQVQIAKVDSFKKQVDFRSAQAARAESGQKAQGSQPSRRPQQAQESRSSRQPVRNRPPRERGRGGRRGGRR